ncbi:hypothetical protein O181_071151 [Austropuccinia psidii MF-1]|uniref:Uncharacterized protein n=1 Tax=Austropuccinia psidii MF-1 TaxID=1389203 RepID=A0A9Q3F069_9BASI|nr:hypothetical protein [Austropuccinia psidii MF-1]
MHIKPECHQGSGAITAFTTPSRFLMWGPNQQSRTSPSALEMSLSWMVLEHSQWVRKAHFSPLDTHKIWTQGTPIPQWTVDRWLHIKGPEP